MNIKVSHPEQLGYAIIACLFVATIIALAILDPIPQELHYHDFPDQNALSFVPNWLNVLSNLPFLFVGFLGLRWFLHTENVGRKPINVNAYKLLFLGITLVGLGSGYYHWAPDNASLVWDRLPMTLAFMSLVSIVITEFVSVRWGRALLFPLILFGAATVIYWSFTEQQGEGDLRPYVFVQFFPMLAIPVLLLCFKSEYKIDGYWWLMFWYLIAKVLEHFDAEIFSTLGWVSGHSLKHVAAAMGTYALLRSYQRCQRKT